MKKKKVLQIGKYYFPYIGGTENHLSTLVGELKGKVDVTVVVANTSFKTSIEQWDGVKVCRIASLGSLFSLPLTLSLPFWLTREEADILHVHLPNPLAVVSYLLCRSRARLVVSYHSDIVKQRHLNPLINPLLVKFLKRASCIIVSSENLIKNSSMLRRFQDKCRIIPHGIDTSRFRPQDETFSKAREIRDRYGQPLILFVGRLVYYKGLEFLLAAMKGVNAVLLVVGDGPLKKRLVRQASRLGVSHKVAWIGEVENEKVAPYYYACNVFILPSSVRSESFGIVQLEAFACGKPVISTDLPTGVPFVNLHNKTGLIVSPQDSSSLAHAIKRMLESPQLCQDYGQNGRTRVQREFTKERMGEAALKVYETVF